MIARTAGFYLLVFAGMLFALDAGAYLFMQREYLSLLQPALSTPEGSRALAIAMRHVLITIATIDLPLLLFFGVVAYLLARAAILPLERARERERLFAADAAHELRTPLAAIAAAAQAARAGAAAHERAALDEIERTAFEASATVADLLTLARHPDRKLLQCEPVDLGAVVLRCAGELESAASGRGIRIESLPRSAIVDGDERRLRELARNLLDNAIRHARSIVRISSAREGKTCRIVVEDDGDGVATADRERIFERFVQRSQGGSGAGLGLAIVRWIAQAHGGGVLVDDAPLGGARFTCSLPAAA